jgi:hypothetical protein
MKIRSLGAELFHAVKRTEGQTDRHDEANSRCFAILRTRLESNSHLQNSFRGWSGRSVTLTNYLLLVPSLRMSGTVPLLRSMDRDNVALFFYLYLQIPCTRMLTLHKFHAEDTKFWADLWASMLSVISVRCVWTGTDFCVLGKSCNKYNENSRCYRKNVLVRAPGVCALLPPSWKNYSSLRKTSWNKWQDSSEGAVSWIDARSRWD